MADDIKIEGIEKIVSDVPLIHPVQRRKKKDRRQRDEAGQHFRELAAKAEQAHKILSDKQSPYRFCVYRTGDEVFIDIAIVDGENRVRKVFKRNITRDEFHTWIQMIESESGMLFDREV